MYSDKLVRMSEFDRMSLIYLKIFRVNGNIIESSTEIYLKQAQVMVNKPTYIYLEHIKKLT